VLPSSEIAGESHDTQLGGTEVQNEILTDAPAERVWHALGARFIHMAD